MISSTRLTYERVSLDTLDELHALVRDEHVRRYLLDGEVCPREWSEACVRDRIELFERRRRGRSAILSPTG